MRKTWVYNPKPAQLDRLTKDILKEKVRKFIESSERLSGKVKSLLQTGNVIPASGFQWKKGS